MSILAAWLHDIDPYALRIWGDFGIRWYGLSYLLGFFIGWLLIRRVTRVGISTLAPAKASDLVITLAIGIVVGGRLGYVLLYSPHLLWTFYGSLPFWGVLAINEGGMASHGGIMGGAIACWWFARKYKQPVLHLYDLLAFGGPLGLFFGRIANFINGELIGRAAPDGLPWAVKFPQEMYDWPAEKLQTAVELYQQQAGLAFPYSLRSFASYAVTRIQAGDSQMRALVEPMLTARHPSQLYAAVLEGLVVFAVLALVWTKPRKPGIVGAWFCISYATVRIFDELFRRPDAHLRDQEFALLGVTRGQWLSVLLLASGLWGIWWASKRTASPMGGWCKTHE